MRDDLILYGAFAIVILIAAWRIEKAWDAGFDQGFGQGYELAGSVAKWCANAGHTEKR